MRRGELADLTAFIAVADNLSFRTAATRLGFNPIGPQPHGPDDSADLQKEASPAPEPAMSGRRTSEAVARPGQSG
jgi:hypothetical protein